MSNIKRAYKIRHKLKLEAEFDAAKKIAQFAVQNKHRKFISSKEVKQYGLPSTISCQILRKYGQSSIKEATNINLIVPNSSIRTYKMKDGTIKEYSNIIYQDKTIILKPLKLKFRWNPGIEFIKINQVEIQPNYFIVCVTLPEPTQIETNGLLGIDLNCGVGRDIANCANLQNGEILNFGKEGPNIRKYYFKNVRFIEYPVIERRSV